MTTTRFEYKLRGGRRQPICDLSLLGPISRVQIDALVDSGATYSIFLRSDAERAGISLPRLPNQPIDFGSGTAVGRRVRSTILLGEQRFSADVVYLDDEQWPPRFSLLGRVGVFSRFKHVRFAERVHPPVVEFAR